MPRRFTSRDEDIAQEFRGVIAQCDDLLGQISELFATAMSDLLCNTSGADGSSGHGEVPKPLSILAGGYEADGDDDDDEDYSDSSD